MQEKKQDKNKEDFRKYSVFSDDWENLRHLYVKKQKQKTQQHMIINA